jgi:hypothetical protein
MSAQLILRLGNLTREGEWGPDDFDVFWNERHVGRIFYTPVASP